MNKESIAAIATAPGQGGVGIVRVSGSEAKTVAQQCLGFIPKPRYATFTEFKSDNGEVLDYGIALLFEGPHSFTGEDVLELQAHGGPVILDLLLTEVIKNDNVRLAKPGEFSEQAFLNNKLDLTQAEAIADLISAQSEASAKAALNSLQGNFSKEVHQVIDDIVHLRTYIEAALDFAEEEIDFLSDSSLIQRAQKINTQLDEVLKSAEQGALIREGISVVLIGQPNVGKSSLLNQLSGQDRAIVTDIAGTTRDVLRETIMVSGLPMHIIDTAGLRESKDLVERKGIERTWKAIEQADMVLHLIDSTNQEFEKEQEILAQIPESITVKTVYTKIDKKSVDNGVLGVSNKTGEGIEALQSFLHRSAGYNPSESGKFSARRRHLDALNQAKKLTEKAYQALLSKALPELVAQDYVLAQQALSSISGTFSSDDLLGEIFSNFCIGK